MNTPPARSLVWTPLAAAGGDYAVAQGPRYAALSSVTLDQSLSAVVEYLNRHGWAVTYAWEPGQPSRGLYAVDDWLAGLSPDPTDHHRWIWIEANRTGSTTTLGEHAPWPFTFYRVAQAFEATPAPPSAAPVLPPAAAIATAAPAAGPSAMVVGVGLGALAVAVFFVVRGLVR